MTSARRVPAKPSRWRSWAAACWREGLPEFAALCTLGAVVAGLMYVVGHSEPVQLLDRAAGDYLMREVARNRLASKDEFGPRVMFVSVGDKTCSKWAEQSAAGCTIGFSAPRDRLAQLVNKISAEHPPLLVLDFDLSPGATGDAALCDAVRDATTAFPVITPMPLVPEPGRAKRARSLLDGGCAAAGAYPLLFASPSLLADADGVVRGVQAWTTVDEQMTGGDLPARDGLTTRDDRTAGNGALLFGVGFLAAAMESEAARNEIGCFVPKPRCEHPISLGDPPYVPHRGTDGEYRRIQFTLPWQPEGDDGRDSLGYSPDRFDVIEAVDLLERPEAARRLAGAVVFVGASYAASGDLHQTPLGGGMPGSVVHANAMVAFSGRLIVEEQKDWWMKVRLILLAAAVGTLFHLGARSASGKLLPSRQPKRPHSFAWLVSLAGVAVNVILVLLGASFWAESDLAESHAMVGAVTPALAVAFEGLAEMAMEVKHAARKLAAATFKDVLSMLCIALPLTALCTPAWAEERGASSATPCGPTPGLQARIVSLKADDGGAPRAWVSRGNDRIAAGTDCLLSIGDRLQAEATTRVEIMLPNRVVKTVLASDSPFVVEQLVPTGILNRTVALLALFAPNLSEAQAAARVRPGLSRGIDHAPPGLSPPVPPVRQRVGLGRPLLLRWEGAGPFAVTVRDKAEHEAVVTTAGTSAELPLSGFVAGAGSLRIQGADGASVTRVEFVPDTSVPVIPGESDVPETARSTWLLLRASAAWRLEAMSRLLTLAGQGDPIAGAILGGVP